MTIKEAQETVDQWKAILSLPEKVARNEQYETAKQALKGRKKELAKLKVEQAHIATGLPYDRIIANVTNQHHRKRSLEGTYIFVDDSPYNIEQSTAAHVLTLNKPWNKTVYRDVKRFNYLNEIIDYIPTLLQRR